APPRFPHPGARRPRLPRERHARRRIEALPADPGEVDLGPGVRIAFAHDEAAREAVLLPRHEPGCETGRNAHAAGEHGQAARHLSTPAEPRVEEEEVDDVDI